MRTSSLCSNSAIACVTSAFIILKHHCEKVWAEMQVPFPDLKLDWLGSNDGTAPVIPDSLLGGSAPHLQFILLHGIPFPGLPKLLSSTTCLVKLLLQDIPHSGYISPQAMATCLSTPTSNDFILNSDPLDPILIGKSELSLHQNILSSPLSCIFVSKGLANIWKTS